MNMFIPCGSCIKGYLYSGDSVTKCQCLKDFQYNEKIKLGLVKSNIFDVIPPDLQNYKGKDLTGNLLKLHKYILGLTNKFSKDSHLYFVGPNGSQKTYTAKAILREAVAAKLNCKFILMNDLIKKLTDIYEEGYANSIDEYYMCDLLVIDDSFDPKKVTLFKSGYQIPYLDEFLRKRIEQYRGNTIFTSNISIDSIDENKFSADIKNLLERSIKDKGGELYFADIYTTIEDKDIINMWN